MPLLSANRKVWLKNVCKNVLNVVYSTFCELINFLMTNCITAGLTVVYICWQRIQGVHLLVFTLISYGVSAKLCHLH
ncbi:hypothetical protein V1512DRAFT_259738 [Lipomyces arxii]|uniref:uncharacterized protein n=1 Tax=Lipomyces arxii TaxID=56418 RepID=UPI0034CDBEC8